MDAIAEKHSGLISGLAKLFDILVAMRYISPSHVIHPPHSSDAVATDTFQRIGLDPEVIKLTQLIPALRSDVVWGWQWFGIELLPRSKAVTYFADCRDPDWIGDLRWGDTVHSEDEKLLPPWMLRLTSGNVYSAQYGLDLIYNTQNQNIIVWPSFGRKAWNESHSVPAENYLEDVVSKFRSLEWVPYYEPNEAYNDPPPRRILENPIILQNIVPGIFRLPLDPPTAVQELKQQFGQEGADMLRHDINKWRAIQELYLACGWGTDSFDGDEFERRKLDFVSEAKKLERIWRKSRFKVLDQQQQGVEQFPSSWDEFLMQNAGPHAV